MIKTAYSILLCFISTVSFSQQYFVDSLLQSFLNTRNDTAKMQSAGSLADHYTELKPDSAYYFAEQELAIAQKLGYKLNEVYALQQMGYAQMNLGNFTHSLKNLLSGIAIANDPASENKILPDKYAYGEDIYVNAHTPHLKRLDKIGRMHLYVGILYGNAGNFEKEKMHYLESRAIAQVTGNLLLQSYCNGTLGRSYLYLKMPDSALSIIQTAYEQSNQVGYRKYQGSIVLNLARVYDTLKKETEAIAYFRKALSISQENGYLRGVVAANISLAEHSLRAGNKDSALYFINQATNTALLMNAPSLELRSYTAKADYYRNPYNSDSIAKYQDLIIPIKNKLFDTRQSQLFQSIDFDEQQRQQQKDDDEKAYRNKLKVYGLLAGLAVFSIVLGFMWRNNQQKQKTLSELKKQKEETDYQRAQAERALSELKSTQAQLVQREKMASLGELTAGIAHEIQNPLNFVNNFSEVNKELVAELHTELEQGNISGAKNILRDIVSNEDKINEHGKRADSIVKGMLQHSRQGTGQKVLVDINTLCDEYLRLAFHGIRAKDKSFNALLKTDFDTSLSKSSLNPQDIGRVLLNIYNNALYAVSEKIKLGSKGYEPVVTVRTRATENLLQITVTDNGTGIADRIADKIFQPFFTTKPAGHGTGLGLSVSYDIIKAHGGQIRVEPHGANGASFVIELPLT